MDKVILGMSGGVDSTLTAIKLKEKGYLVIGVTLHLWDSPSSIKAIEDAKKQALRIGIEHHVLDCRSNFKTKIVGKFVEAYLCGHTPSPCTWCNPHIKWKYIAEFADKIGAYYISSGHYTEIVEHNGHYYIAKGADPKKDQSYYMWMLGEDIVKRMIQPLGTSTKQQTKQEIAERNFNDIVPNRESMSVCFLAGMDYRNFLFEQAPEAMATVKEGPVYDENGHNIGTHQGYPYYTIGQKKGLTLNVERAAYITSINQKTNSLTIGKKEDLFVHEFWVKNLHFINQDEITPATKLEVKVRGLGLNPDGFGTITIKNGVGTVSLENPAWAMSPGQPVVFYIDSRVIGGGIAM